MTKRTIALSLIILFGFPVFFLFFAAITELCERNLDDEIHNQQLEITEIINNTQE